MNIHLLNLPHIIRHPRDAQLTTELPPFPTRAILNRLLKVLAVPLAIGLLDSLHVVPVPVVPHKSGDEQFPPQRVLLGCSQGMVDEQGVAYGLVDDAVEDVC